MGWRVKYMSRRKIHVLTLKPSYRPGRVIAACGRAVMQSQVESSLEPTCSKCIKMRQS